MNPKSNLVKTKKNDGDSTELSGWSTNGLSCASCGVGGEGAKAWDVKGKKNGINHIIYVRKAILNQHYIIKYIIYT